ncbi:MAG: DUF4259 domain-containing protein [Micromonosporaceae bacterium]
MGAWGTGVFDNDDAQDFLVELNNVNLGQLEQFILQALQAAADTADYLQIDDANAAIAAAAAVAAAHAGQTLTGADRAGDLPEPTPELLALAVRALDRVAGDDSEWRKLWGENDALEAAALAAVNDVRANLV